MHRTPWLRVFALLGMSLVLAGCPRETPDPSEIVARVGDAYLTRDVVQELIPENLPPEKKSSYLQKLVNQWIEAQVLAQAARKEGLELSPGEQYKANWVQLDMLGNKYIEQKISNLIPVTEKEIEEYYLANQEEFKRDFAEVHLVHLFLEKRDRAIEKDIRESKSLLEVIEKNYLDQRATPLLEPNGDLGYVIYDHLRPEFKRALRNRKTGEIIGPIRTRDGYHYLQLLDRQPEGSIRSLDMVREEIAARIKLQKRNQEIKKLIESLKEKVPIETHFNHLNMN
ncbi:MAG: hypothetical protein GXO78_12220 [Calditrichaeota bacterium]|nr:hypothetical protein [Calditrichota bacterium]